MSENRPITAMTPAICVFWLSNVIAMKQHVVILLLSTLNERISCTQDKTNFTSRTFCYDANVLEPVCIPFWQLYSILASFPVEISGQESWPGWYLKEGRSQKQNGYTPL
jgi:hypothetical protein